MNTVFGPCGNEITRQIKEGSRTLSPACAVPSSSRQLFMETASSSNTSFLNHQHVHVEKPSRINPGAAAPQRLSSTGYSVFVFYGAESLSLPPSSPPAVFPGLGATTAACWVWSEGRISVKSFTCHSMPVHATDLVSTILDD